MYARAPGQHAQRPSTAETQRRREFKKEFLRALCLLCALYNPGEDTPPTLAAYSFLTLSLTLRLCASAVNPHTDYELPAAIAPGGAAE